MRTTFSGISIALRGLQAQQLSLDVTGHNVANANNPNYSRQTALHAATKPYPTPMLAFTPTHGQLGTGVEVGQINRMRDGFVDLRLRQQLHDFHYWDTLRDGLSQVELFFNEPGENGIDHALDQFWDSLQDLSREPEFASVREVVVQRAQVLVEAIGATRGHLQSLRESVNGNIPLKVSEINSLGTRLAELNIQIGKISATGSLPNDLLDQRDALLEELSQLVDIEVVQDHAQMVGVTVGGASLVHRGTFYNLMSGSAAAEDQGYRRHGVFWAATGNEVIVESGELAGYLHLRDGEIQDALDGLDQWTYNFAAKFNEIHRGGFDLQGNGPASDQGEPDFFLFEQQGLAPGEPPPFAAMNIKVNENIAANTALIRASSVQHNEGNGQNALELARLRFERVIQTDGGGGQSTSITIGDAFNALISKLGVNTQRAIKMSENEETLTEHLRNLKEATAGVSLDEEMANMIRFQHAYNAAARMMTAVDETLDTIINRLGVVGR